MRRPSDDIPPSLLSGRILERDVADGVVADSDLPHADDAVATNAGCDGHAT
ncbi:hypothetical protein HFN69_29945 [Rhizobium laguerreae]|uniref:hypothetical protein n=1 Tax=Rhizobium laguerreae TaxID=1076926 RepID=UPI001C926614|nr:hypothetical protein [Rhizobium laguerreae]MBY3544027.1 hypothetical protein [Rhizobium laguerreae]MBY3550785.1 hypothetical protein [Rhizobium laguerreae]